jgi:hypothetical protein
MHGRPAGFGLVIERFVLGSCWAQAPWSMESRQSFCSWQALFGPVSYRRIMDALTPAGAYQVTRSGVA